MFIEAANVFLSSEEQKLAEELLAATVTRLGDCSPKELRRLAKALSGVGRTDDALMVVRLAFRGAIAEDAYLAPFAAAWLEVGGSRCADDIATELVTADTSAETRMDVAEEFAEAGLLEPAVTVWLDIVRHHGNAVEHGVAAADRLVRCGNREETIAALRDALANHRLSPSARTRHRALLAWVAFLDPAAAPAQVLDLLG